MENTQSALGTEKIGRIMRKYALPCVISLLVGAFYNIVDQVFIANASYLGSNGNAANTAVFPLTVIALGVAVMIGDGACAFVSISLGEKKTRNASLGVGNAVSVCSYNYCVFSNAFSGKIAVCNNELIPVPHFAKRL